MWRFRLLGATVVLFARTAWCAEPPPPAPPSTALPEGQRWVWVTFAANGSGARLEAYEGRAKHGEEDDDEHGWRRVCNEPCGVFVPSGRRFRINGPFRVSAALTLPPWHAARLDIAPVRSGLRALGIVLTATGATVGVYAGSAYLFSGAFRIGGDAADTDEERASAAERRADARRVQGVVALSAFATFGVGLTLFFLHRKTTVDLRHPDAPLPGAALGLRGPSLGLQLSQTVWISPAGLHF